MLGSFIPEDVCILNRSQKGKKHKINLFDLVCSTFTVFENPSDC